MTHNDRNIALAALAVGAMALTGIWWAGSNGDVDNTTATATDTTIIKPATLNTDGQTHYYYDTGPRMEAELFLFDPNTADSVQLLRLGLKPWTVRNIYKYRARGGVFRHKQDFARLYGLTVKDYRRLEPYIRISSDYQPAATLVSRQPFGKDTIIYPPKIDTTQHVVLNTADTTQLRTVPGIGHYFAREIIMYGQRLGGYVDVNQLDEIDYFPQESKRFFVIHDPQPRKLNVNRLTLQQLRRHPYINFYQAKAITDYRRLRGSLHSLNDLRLAPEFTDKDILRLEPYVEF